MKTLPKPDFFKALLKPWINFLLVFTLLGAVNDYIFGQSILCDTLEHVRVFACDDFDYHDSCYLRKFNVYFTEVDTTSDPSEFEVNDFQLTVIFSGDGYIDEELSEVVGASGWNTIYNSTAPNVINFRPALGCQEVLPLYGIPFGNCSDPFAEIYVVVPPGDHPQLDDLQATALMSDQFVVDNCNNPCPIEFNDVNIGTNAGATNACDSNLVVKVHPFIDLSGDTLVSNPHTEVPVEVVLYNNGPTNITVFDYDIRVKIEDQFDNLPGYPDFNLFLVPTPNSGGDAPYIEEHIGNEHYFFLDEMQFPGQSGPYTSQEIEAGDSVVLLAYTVLPPALSNEYGLADFTVDFVRMSYEDTSGTYCCTLNVDNPVSTVEFPGDLPCDQEPSVRLGIVDHSPIQMNDCELAFDICAEIQDSLGNPDSIALSEFFVEVNTLTTGNLQIDRIIGPSGYTYTVGSCNPGQICPGGGSGCTSCSGSVSYLNNDTAIVLHHNDCFTVILRGADMTEIERVEFTSTYLRFEGDTVKCIPEIKVDDGNILAAENSCEHCLDYTVYIGEYNGTLGKCETGFSVWLNANSGNDLDSIHLEIDFANTDDLTIKSITSTSCQTNHSCIPPNDAGITKYDSCVYTINGTNRIVYQHCPVSPVSFSSGGSFNLFSVILEGELGDCINDVQFTMQTAIGGDSTATCVPSDTTSDSNNDFCITNCPNTEASIEGLIRLETGEGVKVPILPESANFPNDLADFTSGIFILTNPANLSNNCALNVDSLGISPYTVDGNCDTIVEANCELGSYSANLDCEADTTYVIQPYKDINYVNRVTTYDLVLISQHILGIDLLDSPYKMIAADANNNTFITTLDIVEFRKLILNIDTNLPDNTSWRFVDESYVFQNPSNPLNEDFPECIEVNSTEVTTGSNFVAIKIGDVGNIGEINCSTSLSSGDSLLLDRGLESNYADFVDLLLWTETNVIQAGEMVNIDFIFKKDANIAAWQMGLEFDAELFDFKSIIPSASLSGISSENFGLTEVERGKIRGLWFHPEGKEMSFKEGITSFRLQVKAKKKITNILDHFEINHETLQSIAFQLDGSAYEIQINERIAETSATKFVPAAFPVQVIPNPFKEQLEFNFQFSTAKEGQIRIYDFLGRQVDSWEGIILTGQGVFFENTAHWGEGIFLWEVKIGDQIQTGKIIKK